MGITLRTYLLPGSIHMHMAQASRSPGTSDGRIPCPVCGGPIHPVAGRCKHCKTDLVRLREQRGHREHRAQKVDARVIGAAAAAPLVAPAPFAPAPMGAMPGAPGARPDATPLPAIAPQPFEGDGELIEMQPARRPRWPLLVAIVAGIAIVICVILLLDDDGDSKAGKAKKSAAGGANGAMPAPDRMDTNPAPPPDISTRPDPWKDPGTPTQPDPLPDPAPDVDDPDLQNPFADPDPPDPASPPPSAGGPLPTAEQFTEAVVEAGCSRLKACGMDQTIGTLCSAVGQSGILDLFTEQVRNGRCTYNEDAASRCLSAIQNFKCPGGSLDLDQLSTTYLSITECSQALSCP